MARNALGPVKLEALARTNASAADQIEGLSPYKIMAVQVDGSGAAAGTVSIQGSLRAAADDDFVELASVTTGANDTDLVHLVDLPVESLRIVYAGLAAGAVDVKVTPMTEGP